MKRNQAASLAHQATTTMIGVVVVLATTQVAFAEAPEIRTEGMLIYLADNLHEKAWPGWCIDTEGRGLSDQLQSHSCKLAGEDTVFFVRRDHEAD